MSLERRRREHFFVKPREDPDPIHLFQSNKFMPSHHSSAKTEIHPLSIAHRPSSIIHHQPCITHSTHRNSMAPKQPRSFNHDSSSCWNLLLLLLGISAFSLLGKSPEKPHLLVTIRRMEIDSIDSARYLVEADIVKPLEARTVNLAHTMIWHQEFLFPAHEHVFPVCAVFIMEVGLLGLLRKRPPCREARPMLHILFVAGAPVFMTGLEGILWADDLSFEESSEGSVFGC